MTRRLTREEMTFLERRHAQRLGWGPYYAGAAVFVVGHLSWPISEMTETRTVLAVIAALSLMWIISRINGWNRVAYSLGCLGTAYFLIFRLYEVQTFKDWFAWFFWFFVAVHILGIGWWSSRVKRTEVHLEDDLRGWQEIAKNFGLASTTRHITKRDAVTGNESGFLVWPRGALTVANVLDKREQLEGAMGLPEGSLRLMKHGNGRAATDRVDYVAFTDDPLTEAIEWPGPQQAKDGGDLSVDVPALIGLQEDKKPGYLPYYDRDINAVVNKLFGGSQGSGKSGGLNLHIADVACRSDGTQWGIDMKDGMEIAPLERIMDNLACNHDELTEMIEALDAIMTYRGEENTRRARKAWPVSPTEPLLFVWMDELHRVMGANGSRDARAMRRCEEVLIRLATTGRALGMSANGATQNPTLEAMRTSQFRDRLNQRICFRTESSAHEGYIIPNRKVDAHLIPSAQPGMAYIQDRDNWTGMPVRYFRVTDEMLEMVMSVRAPGLPLDLGSRRAACAVSPRYAARCRERYGDDFDSPQLDVEDEIVTNNVTHIAPEPIPEYPLTGDVEDVPLAAIHRAYRAAGNTALAEPVSVADALEGRVADARVVRTGALPEGEDAVMEMLRNRGVNGASAQDLWLGADRGKSWFHREVKRWLANGTVVQPGGDRSNYVLAELVQK